MICMHSSGNRYFSASTCENRVACLSDFGVAILFVAVFASLVALLQMEVMARQIIMLIIICK